MKDYPVQLHRFGKCVLDPEKKILWCDSQPVSLPLKAVELLSVLVERRGQVVTKDEIWSAVWQDSFVEETNLTHNIYLLRKAFRDLGEPELIQTVPRRGYRFSGELLAVNGNLVIEKHSITRTLVEEIDAVENRFENALPVGSSHPRMRWLRQALLAAAIFLAIGGGGAFYLRSAGTDQVPAESDAVIANDSFEGNGLVTTDLGYSAEKAQAAVLLADGRIAVGGWVGDSVATGDFALAVYNPDGSLDKNFNGGGKVITALSPHTDIVYALAVQGDGKIVAAGVTFTSANTRRFCILRYKLDGSLDASFDGDGIVTLEIGNSEMDTANAVALQPDGKIVVAGSANVAIVSGDARLSQNDFAFARLNTDGSLDTSFGEGGKVTTDFGRGGDIPYSIVIQPDGKIVAGGVASNGVNQDFALARYHPTGEPDASFGKGGKVRTDFFGEDELIGSVILQQDGKILAAGYTQRIGADDVAVARYADDGSLDNSFSGDGKASADIVGNDIARGIATQPDGRIVVCVYANHAAYSEFALLRLHPSGDPDDRFGQTARLNFPGEAFAMVMTTDGHAVLAGSTGNSSDFALLRIRL